MQSIPTDLNQGVGPPPLGETLRRCVFRNRCWVVLFALFVELIAQVKLVHSAEPRGVIPTPGTSVKTLSQNWDDEAEWFYNTPQGSYLIRYKWFLNLEQATSKTLFRDVSNIQKLGYLARSRDDNGNPDGLPIGFVKDPKPIGGGQSENYLGLTCAACHTGYVQYRNTMYLLDGAPTQGNFEELLRQLTEAMNATVANDEKFDRFAKAVLGEARSTDTKTILRSQLSAAVQLRAAYNDRNLPAAGATPFGPGRVDAFGAIMNEVAERFAQVAGNHTAANAPVSYPVLWDAPQHDFVQWNGAAENKKSKLTEPIVGTEHIGALGRNTGEVLGVFGEIDASAEPSIKQLKHYPNSAKRGNLIAIEDSLRNLWSPEWPDDFPRIKPTLSGPGRLLFEKHCAECHGSIDRDSDSRKVEAKLSDEQTDPLMARNFLTRVGRTGVLRGRRVEPLSTNLANFGDRAPVGLMLKHLVQSAIIRADKDVLAAGEARVKQLVTDLQSKIDYQISGRLLTNTEGIGERAGRFVFGGEKGVNSRVRKSRRSLLQPAESRLDEAVTEASQIELHYKARPLNGIWASAPYLHNGSIPNLDELLKRPNERSQADFKVGSAEFDPVKVGFRTDKGENFDPKLPGNWNLGESLI
jgi:hypothetical protein